MMIKKMVIFMVAGAVLIADGQVLKTGQTTVYKQGDDGTYQAGKVRSYTRSAMGMVTDNASGLQWQDDYADNGGVIIQTDWMNAADYCAAFSLEGGGWRLPTEAELHTLVDRGRTDPAIDPIFQNIAKQFYWSSVLVIGTESVWGVNFDAGLDEARVKTTTAYVKCVRSVGQ